MSSTGKEQAGSSSGGQPRCAACEYIPTTVCLPGCVYAPFFPPGDPPQRFAAVHIAFGADSVARLLRRFPQGQWPGLVDSLVLEATRRLALPGDDAAAGRPRAVPPPPWEVRRPCAACQHLRRACVLDCIFAPHFPPTNRPGSFANLDKVYGANSVAHFLRTSRSPAAARAPVPDAQQRPGAAAAGGTAPCAACQRLQRTCVLDCVFAPHFPPGDDPARFATAHAAFGADDLARILGGLPLHERTSFVGMVVDNAAAQQRAVSPPPPGAGGSQTQMCEGCKCLGRNCGPGCELAPHFPADSDPTRFEAVDRVYGAGNFAALLRVVPPERRSGAAATLVREARYRGRDSVYRIAGSVGTLLMELKRSHEVLVGLRILLSPRQAEAEQVPPQEDAMDQRAEDMVRKIVQAYRRSLLDPAAAVPEPVAAAIANLQQQQQPPPQAPAVDAGVQDPVLPEAEDAGDHSSTESS